MIVVMRTKMLMTGETVIALLVTAVFGIVPAGLAGAAPSVLASDDAAAYTSADFRAGINHGKGWKPFVIKSTVTSTEFPGSAISGSRDIGSGPTGNVFDIYAFGKDANGNPATTVAARMFGFNGQGDAALKADETFATDLANKGTATGGTVGFGLADATGKILFKFFLTGGATNYSVQDANGIRDSNIASAGRVFKHIAFSLTSPTTYQLAVPADAVAAPTILKGKVDGEIDQVVYFNIGGGNGSDVTFNHLTVTRGIGTATFKQMNMQQSPVSLSAAGKQYKAALGSIGYQYLTSNGTTSSTALCATVTRQGPESLQTRRLQWRSTTTPTRVNTATPKQAVETA